MNKKEMEALALKAASSIKTEQDLNDFSRVLKKITVEAALGAELDEHLACLSLPAAGRLRQAGMDDKILFLYAQGMTTRESVAAFKDLYDADVSAGLISRVTNAVVEQGVEWQSRPLDAVYPIVYLDCIVVKIRQDKRVINKAIYLALSVNLEGHKALLGLWLSENEGAKFWLSVLTELQTRGVKDILIACVDGLKGVPEAIEAVYPDTRIQLCIVHQVRHSMKFVPWQDDQPVTAALKRIDQATTAEQAQQALNDFAQR